MWGRPWALGVWKACFLGTAGILLPFMGPKFITACALKPWDGAEDIHSWGFRHRGKRGPGRP